MTIKNYSDPDVFGQGFRQVETVQLAPDALVFINGSNLLTDSEGNTFNVRDDITEITTSLNIESTPGTASFTISVPDHGSKKYRVESYRGGIQIMSEVEIYFRGRFKKSNSNNDFEGTASNDNAIYPYYPAFWGIVQSASESYNDGVFTISISCADILRWWQITNIVMNPSLIASTEKAKAFAKKFYGVPSDKYEEFSKGQSIVGDDGRTISINGSIFAGMTIPEIFKAISNASLLDLSPLTDYLDANIKTQQITQEHWNETDSSNMMEYWLNRLTLIGRNLKIFRIKKDSPAKGRFDLDTKITTDTGQIQIMPYILTPEAPPITNSQRKSQLEIANELKENVHYEFFMDVNGEIIFKPPFWNIDVRANTPNSIIDDIDIINYNVTQSESEIVTRVDVSGNLSTVTSNSIVDNGISYDPRLTLQFGERIVPRNVPWLTTKEKCQEWAALELAMQTANIRQCQMTIIGRPELRLGYPIFVPSRDCFYYIKGIEHSFVFGSSFTTTLTLNAERRKKKDENGKAITLGLLRSVGEEKSIPIITEGSSQAEPVDNNNFVKQLFTPNICTPKAKEVVSAVKPNFAFDISKISSDPISDWQSLRNISVDQSSKKDIQITDEEGYELVGQKYDFGRKLSISSIGKLNDKLQTINSKWKASQAIQFDIEKSQMEQNPNNTAYTLDQTENKMLIDTKNPDSKAQGLLNPTV
jgi:hypothetical protein